ncbi:hypothetical protein MA16_Dca028482 [Dendrobium catenatum]|uniref:Uncharacterized protein n=1 Tax=Dendrobium catenatum TaxID=906689 RepID=A0A2I0V7A0_9ASPA|nr:hypothetical protein MA16_Dca028482 [Dendrobium catenatum]
MAQQLFRPNILQAFECFNSFQGKLKPFYNLSICSAIYHLWRERNDRKFGNVFASSTTLSHKIKSAVLSKLLKWKNGYALLDLL